MHTVPSYSLNYHYYTPRCSDQVESPVQDNDLVETTRVVTPITKAYHTKQEYDCPDSPDLAGDDLVNTLIVGSNKLLEHERPTLQDSLLSLPPGIVELLLSLENLSNFLPISEKQSLSHQLTKLSYSLQTQCLYPDTNQEYETPTKRSPSPPILTPRKPNSHTPSVPIVAPRMSTPSTISDWSGPGSFPTFQDQNRPTKLNVHTLPASPHYQRSVGTQYDQKCLVKQKSEVIYANTSSSPVASDLPPHKPNLAPPLPPRDHTGSDYQNLPPSRGSKKKGVDY